MKQRATKYRVQITKKNQRRSFQLRLPENAIDVVGLELTHDAVSSDSGQPLPDPIEPLPTGIGSISIPNISAPLVVKSNHVGDLFLWANDITNGFFSADITQSDNVNRDLALMGLQDISFGGGKPWIDGVKSLPVRLNESVENTLLHGYFLDESIVTGNEFTPYWLNIYLYLTYDFKSL